MKRYLLSIVFFITISELLIAGANFKKGNEASNKRNIAKKEENSKNSSSTAIDYKSVLVDDNFVDRVYAQRTANLEITINPDPIRRGHGFSITLNNTEDAELKIIDVLGKLVLKRNIKGIAYIDNPMERGVYLLIIKTSTNSITKKLIVE